MDTKQNGLLFDCLWQPPPAGTVTELVAIAARIAKKSQELRRQIVFTGSKVASDAVHVYAPHEALPDLMDQLAAGIRFEAPGVSPVDRVAVLGYYCVHAHPFKDGNGRWTRALCLAVERRSLLKTVAAVSFQTVCPRALAEVVWPQTRVQGLRAYLEACNAYTERLLATYHQSPVRDSMNMMHEALRKAAKGPAKFQAISRLVFVNRKLDIAETKQLLGVSSRVAEGLFHTLAGCGLSETPGGLAVDSLLKEVDGYADVSASFFTDNLKASQ
ncbi:MAG: Fic family protein [Pseudomonadota bacterium]|nr:Fic family protein [Pseudomonadota bacterium]